MVRPFADRGITSSSIPGIRLESFMTAFDLNEPYRSLGTSIVTGRASVRATFGREPMRELPWLHPSKECLSPPRRSLISTSSSVSSTPLVRSRNNRPGATSPTISSGSLILAGS